ncbi:6-methylsalicylic acid synthase [Apiospora sp. TS-2023a]
MAPTRLPTVGSDSDPADGQGPVGQNDFTDDAIAIIGAGCRLPGANNLEDLWDIISQGQSRLEKLRPERCSPKDSYRAIQDPAWIAKREFYGNFIDDVDAFDHAFFGISPREAAHMDPQQRLLLETAFQAMDSSGYLHDHQRERGDPVGCFIGASYTEYLENTSAYSPSAFTATSTIRAFLSGKISYHFGWTGPSEVIDTACSASLVAVHRACRAIQAGECTMALAGGVNVITGVHNYFDLAKAGFLSPTGQCKPFDDSADGYCRADGVCLVVLKPLRQAIADGDDIMGVIPAVATNQGGVHAPGITVPDGTCQKALYKTLLNRSGLGSNDISYIEAHGTGTRVGDPIEMASIRDVFGGSDRTNPLYIGSLKSNIGHSETAAGAAGLLKVLAMLRHGGIPPLRGFKQLNHNIPSLEPDNIIIPTDVNQWSDERRRIACISSYGASGSNSALLCAEWRRKGSNQPPILSTSHKKTSGYPICLSAATPESLLRYAEYLVQHLSSSTTELDFGNVAYTLSKRRKHHRFRWSTMASDMNDLINQLRGLDERNIVPRPKVKKKVVLAFSGQSGTKIGLDPLILRDNPRFGYHLQSCNRILIEIGCPDIMSALHQTEPISDVSVLQCGLVAVQYACARCWIDGGLEVAGIVGHSLGELAALAVSEVLSLEDMLRVVYTRAELIKGKFGDERGGMVAIHANLNTVDAIMKTAGEDYPTGDGLEIACYNSLTSHVVVGSENGIQATVRILEEDSRYRGVRFHRVDVTHGFHSLLTEPLLEGLSQVEKEITFREPSIPLKTSTKDPVLFGNQKSNGYLAKHAREPVYFVDAVRRLETDLGPCVWVEAGLGSPVIPMARRALASPEQHTFILAASPETVAAELWREGITATSWRFLTPVDSHLRHVWLPPYSFDRPKHWLDHIDHAAEEHKKAQCLSNGVLDDPQSYSKLPPRLVSYSGVNDGDPDSHIFRLNTNTQRYVKIVQGHSVRGKPLCPASVYMEAAVMALDLLGVTVRGASITFWDTVFSRPLGCDPNLQVALILTPHLTDKPGMRDFSVKSSPRTTHAEGSVEIATTLVGHQPDSRLLMEKIAMLRNNQDSETLKSTTAYRLFSRVVEYAGLMQGIVNITLGPMEAVARIQAPKTSFTGSESTVTDFYDAITLDTFIQVLGLLVNHSTSLESTGKNDDIYVASSIGKMRLSPVDFSTPQVWTAYAAYSMVHTKTASGEVYVLSEKGEVVFSATDIRFVRVAAAAMERLLEAANPTTHCNQPKVEAQEKLLPRNSAPNFQGSQPVATQQPHFTAGSEANLDESLVAGTMESRLKSLVSSYTGVLVEDMEPDATLCSLGLDSLASIELADEIEAKLGLKMDMADLGSETLQSLLKVLSPSSSGTSSLSQSGCNTSLTTPFSGSDAGEQEDSPLTPEGSSQSLGKRATWVRPKAELESRYNVEPHVYKKVDRIDILADVYVPTLIPTNPMCVALMIHGGGHLTLSRRAVRPRQTKHLLAHGVLPVSLDYRLCPQVNVLDGAMADMRDACIWAQRDLPDIMQSKGIIIDRSRYVVVGWSTGGTLAMTTAWTLNETGFCPPTAILSFYCPVEYDPKGDPRSELVLALIKEDRGMSLLFNDNPLSGDELPYPDAKRAAAFSPLVHLRDGDYRTPTCLVFGNRDEIAPFDKAVDFGQEMEMQGVRGRLMSVEGAKHIFDLDLAPGSKGWELDIEPAYEFLLNELGDAS